MRLLEEKKGIYGLLKGYQNTCTLKAYVPTAGVELQWCKIVVESELIVLLPIVFDNRLFHQDFLPFQRIYEQQLK